MEMEGKMHRNNGQKKVRDGNHSGIPVLTRI